MTTPLERRAFRFAFLAAILEVAAARRGDEPPDDRREYVRQAIELFNIAGAELEVTRARAAADLSRKIFGERDV